MALRALVTGATGFIGSHLVDSLLAAGWEVRCLVRSPERARALAALPVALEPGDLADEAALGRALQGAEYVFHVAGVTRASQESEYHLVNAVGTEHLLRACARQGASLQRVVLVSSLAAVGPAADGVPRTEESPCQPVSPYGFSKLNAELAALRWMEYVPCTIVRPPVVYGPRDTDNLVLFRLLAIGMHPTFGRPLYLSLVHVRELVDGILAAATCPQATGRTYFLSGSDASLDEVLELIGACLGREGRNVRMPLPLLYAAAWLAEGLAGRLGVSTALTRNKVQELRHSAWLCSAERARRELGFTPRVGLEAGLAETARWYRAAGWLG